MIVVTTPTGHIGSKVLKQLVKTPERIRVIARDPSKLPEPVLAKAEVIKGSLDDFELVAKAYEGAEQVFFIIPPSHTLTNVDDYYRLLGKVTCDAVKAARVQRIVYISGTGLGYEKTAGGVSASFLVEEMLERLGIATRIMHCGTFMENLFHAVQPITFKSEFSTSVPGDVKLPWVATQDIADAAVKLLLDKTWSGNGSVAVLGPEDLSYNDVSRVISESLGKAVAFKTISGEELKARMMGFGSSEAAAEGLVEIYASMEKGVFNRVVRTKANSSPTGLRQWFDKEMRGLVGG